MSNKEFDLVVYGATSFVGQILCDYLVNEHLEPNLSWAMAARSGDKLASLKARLGSKADSIPVIIADSFDESALAAMCQRTSVIISTVGPYALYGEALLRCCAESGTDYCDLTGEAPWIADMIARYENSARLSGARIVNCCGFDSIPSDLGVRFLQEQSMQAFSEPCVEVRMGVRKMRGGASGGTVASGVNMYKQAAKDPELRKSMANPYSLCGDDHGYSHRQAETVVEYLDDFDSWAAPFIMAAINTRVVLRSNFLSESAWGREFRYSEVMLTGQDKKGKKRAANIARGLKLGAVAMSLAPTRWLALKFLPKPGEGPSPEEQRQGCFELEFHGRTESGARIVTRVTGDRDPGYGCTAKMLAQSAISLRRDVDKSERAGGFWTPATVFGPAMFDRLSDHAGMSFELLHADQPALLEDQSQAATGDS